MTQPNPLPPTVAELRDIIDSYVPRGPVHDAADKALNQLFALASRADPAPVADEAAIEGAMMRLANTARTAGSMGMWHQLNPNQPSECADWEERVHVRASELRGLMRAAPRNDDGRLRKLREFYETRNAYMDDQSKRWHAEGNAHIAAEYRGHLAESHRVIDEIDKLLAESPAGDAVGLFGDDKLRSEIAAKWGHAGAHVEVFDDLRARLQAAEAESNTLRKLNTAHVASVEKLQAAYDDAKKQLAEADAERDKLAADLAAAKSIYREHWDDCETVAEMMRSACNANARGGE